MTKASEDKLEALLKKVRQCTICEDHLPLGPNPVLRAEKSARIVIIGQAPGTRVHQSSIPWDDPSGNNLRKWMNVDKDTFYDESQIAIIPMGFCYPGKGKSGDLPPRKECAAEWHDRLFAHLPNLELYLLVGTYAQKHYLPNLKKTLTDTVGAFEEYLPTYFPLVHPSPRNIGWQKRNPWFTDSVVPALQKRVGEILRP
jgi:uracil-DNA glycosylase